jgi:hypothetical protein
VTHAGVNRDVTHADVTHAGVTTPEQWATGVLAVGDPLLQWPSGSPTGEDKRWVNWCGRTRREGGQDVTWRAAWPAAVRG